jgi:hypothetical protein
LYQEEYFDFNVRHFHEKPAHSMKKCRRVPSTVTNFEVDFESSDRVSGPDFGSLGLVGLTSQLISWRVSAERFWPLRD